ncbi:hypothetical protein VP01_3173g3 [Puccinia sorghi]|uniref:Charged multivesicular body protein 3 n=1 Tax=Puccinia sorghi TaxID=27349 RepID=A0A0L6UYU8_9BASI|nr:hypothetical protein VP01_3173g3 [Puccinia sorghi]
MESVNRFLYGPSPEERVRKWQAKIRTEERQMDREIRGIESAQNKVKIQLKQLAAKNDLKNCKMLAKEIVRSNKQKDRLYTSKARLNSIRMQLQHQLATLKISGTLQKSTEIMKLSNSLMKLPELNKTMQEMSKEMMKVRWNRSMRAGIMSEMMEDAIDTLDEDEEELEEEAEAEVQNVLFSITDGKLGQMGSVGGKLPQVCPASSLITFKAAFSPVDFSPITTGYRVLSSCRRGRPGRHRKNASTTEWPPPELEAPLRQSDQSKVSSSQALNTTSSISICRQASFSGVDPLKDKTGYDVSMGKL